MSKRLGWLLWLSVAACGGTTQGENAGQAGSNAGGYAGSSGGASGQSAGGAAGAAGKSGGAGGSANVAGSAGVAGFVSMGGASMGGSTSEAGAAGAPLDPRCPPLEPTGSCTAEQANASCHYNDLNRCLCYPAGPFVYPCPQVDPKCGTGGASATPPPGAAGAGGVSAKIAAPPNRTCTCAGGVWSCVFGI